MVGGTCNLARSFVLVNLVDNEIVSKVNKNPGTTTMTLGEDTAKDTKMCAASWNKAASFVDVDALSTVADTVKQKTGGLGGLKGSFQSLVELERNPLGAFKGSFESLKDLAMGK